MKFGVFFLLQSPDMRPGPAVYKDMLEQAELADRLGFDAIWLAEHHFSSYGYSSAPLLAAIAIAQRTRNVRIGTAVLVLPLHHPLRLAEEIAVADVLTEGRLDVGIGRGYQPYEFERFGLRLEDSRQRYAETLDIILAALSRQTFSYHGRYYDIPPTTILPRPVQTPHPPVWTVAQSPESVQFTVERGYSCLLGGPLPSLRQFRSVYDEAMAAGSGSKPPYLGIHKHTYVADSDADARAHLDHAYWHLRAAGHLRAGTQRVEDGRTLVEPLPNEPDPEQLRRDYVLFGTPEQVSDQLRQYQDVVGMNYVSCVFSLGTIPQERVLRSMELFATRVMPEFRDA